MQVSLYNVKKNGKLDYLSIGEDMLPTVFMVRDTAACPLGLHAPIPGPSWILLTRTYKVLTLTLPHSC